MEVRSQALVHTDKRAQSVPPRLLTSLSTSPRTTALTLADSMDQLSQRSSSSRTQFLSREDLDQEGSLDLEHEQYLDPEQSIDQELEHNQAEEDAQRNVSMPTKTLEVKVGTCTKAWTARLEPGHSNQTGSDHLTYNKRKFLEKNQRTLSVLNR